jgi:streptogramin lyase
VPRARGQTALRIPAGPDVTDVADADGEIWTASSADGAVRRLHGTGWTVVARGVRPIALAGDARHVVAADAGAGALLRLQPPRPAIRLGGMPVDVALAGDDAWVADAAGRVVRKVDLTTGRPEAAIRVGGSPIAIAADARGVYVVCRDNRTLVRLDPLSGAVRERSSLPFAPAAVALDAAHVWIAAGQGDVIRVAR